MSTSKCRTEVTFGYFWVRFFGINRKTCQYRKYCGEVSILSNWYRYFCHHYSVPAHTRSRAHIFEFISGRSFEIEIFSTNQVAAGFCKLIPTAFNPAPGWYKRFITFSKWDTNQSHTRTKNDDTNHYVGSCLKKEKKNRFFKQRSRGGKKMQLTRDEITFSQIQGESSAVRFGIVSCMLATLARIVTEG